MAAVLLPGSPRYNLGTLGKELLITIPNSHRALDDAKLTHAVYFKLYEKAITLPVDILAEIVRQGDDVDWDGRWIFRQILRARIREPLGAMSGSKLDYGAIFGRAEILSQPLEPNKEIVPLDEDEVSALLEHGGAFAQKFPGFEQRPQQLEMLRQVTHALSESQHLLVEAGTGTGKSFAYLVPAALFSTRNNTRVVISTNTINLQDQLIQKDIPDLRKALGLDLRAVVLKGRSNYLCPRRLEILRQRGPDSAEAVRVLGKVLVWLQKAARATAARSPSTVPASARCGIQNFLPKMRAAMAPPASAAWAAPARSSRPGRPPKPPISSWSTMPCCWRMWSPATASCPNTST